MVNSGVSYGIGMVTYTYSPGSLVFEINDIKNLAIEQLHYAFRSILKPVAQLFKTISKYSEIVFVHSLDFGTARLCRSDAPSIRVPRLHGCPRLFIGGDIHRVA